MKLARGALAKAAEFFDCRQGNKGGHRRNSDASSVASSLSTNEIHFARDPSSFSIPRSPPSSSTKAEHPSADGRDGGAAVDVVLDKDKKKLKEDKQSTDDSNPHKDVSKLLLSLFGEFGMKVPQNKIQEATELLKKLDPKQVLQLVDALGALADRREELKTKNQLARKLIVLLSENNGDNKKVIQVVLLMLSYQVSPDDRPASAPARPINDGEEEVAATDRRSESTQASTTCPEGQQGSFFNRDDDDDDDDDEEEEEEEAPSTTATSTFTLDSSSHEMDHDDDESVVVLGVTQGISSRVNSHDSNEGEGLVVALEESQQADHLRFRRGQARGLSTLPTTAATLSTRGDAVNSTLNKRVGAEHFDSDKENYRGDQRMCKPTDQHTASDFQDGSEKLWDRYNSREQAKVYHEHLEKKATCIMCHQKASETKYKTKGWCFHYAYCMDCWKDYKNDKIDAKDVAILCRDCNDSFVLEQAQQGGRQLRNRAIKSRV